MVVSVIRVTDDKGQVSEDGIKNRDMKDSEGENEGHTITW